MRTGSTSKKHDRHGRGLGWVSGWLKQLLTHPINRLDNYRELFETLTTVKDTIKVYCPVA